MIGEAELPRMIFTVSTGRCGTDFLSKILGRLDAVHSEHEPTPDFVEVMRDAQRDPNVAVEFLRERKLPAIQETRAQTYVETSHLFGKGFFEPLFELGILPDVIFLSREQRDVAKSLLRIGTIPERTENGRKYLLSPNDPDVLPISDWEELSDYQLCYWYTLETSRRTECYREFLRRFGKSIPRVSLDKLRTWHGFRDLAYGLSLKRPSRFSWPVWQHRLKTSTNRKAHFPNGENGLAESTIQEQEKQVEAQVEAGTKLRRTREQQSLRDVLKQRNIDFDSLPIKQATEDLRGEHATYLRDVSTPDMAVSLELASFMLALCRVWRPQRMLDLGSGFSSYVLRKYAAEAGGGTVYSIDDDKQWQQKTVQWLKDRGLSHDHLHEWNEFKQNVSQHGKFDLVLYDMGSMATRIAELRFVLSKTMHENSLVILDDVHKADYEQYARYVCRSMNLKWSDASSVSLDDINRCSAVASHC